MTTRRDLRLVLSPPSEPLWREVLGARLRRLRHRRRLTLTQVARRAGVSPQYLSEIERGRKDPSSEMLAAVAGALGCRVLDLTAGRVTVTPPQRQLRGPRLLAA
jgi:transcriptional regulator with XRE-family HTH domain